VLETAKDPGPMRACNNAVMRGAEDTGLNLISLTGISSR